MNNLFFLLALSLLGILGILFSYSKKSDCFSNERIENISMQFPPQSIPSDIKQILKQKFYFLGSGNQSFAFESSDRKYVLKLIKYSLSANSAKKREQKLNRVLNGFKIAYSENAAHCGLLFIKMAEATESLPVSIHDKVGRLHLIDLSKHFFAIQKKAVPLKDILTQNLVKGQLDEVKLILEQLYFMYSDEMRHGILDQDHNVMHNTGYSEGKPMRIDFGKIVKDKKAESATFQTQELHKICHERIIPWLKKYYPNHLNDLTIVP